MADLLCGPVVGEAVPLDLPAGTLVLQDGDRWVSATLSVDRETGRLVKVTVIDEAPDAATASGFLIPGLIDTHVHLTATTANLAELSRLPPSYTAIAAVVEARASA